MTPSFSQFIQQAKASNHLIVQPRMGFGTLTEMNDGLLAVKAAQAPTIGTITLDSYTRVNQYDKATQALKNGEALNGYPIVSHGAEMTKTMLKSLLSKDFVIQVRHGTALPLDVFQIIIASDIDATEGGPVSYCMPYSRVPLKAAIENWRKSCQLFAKSSTYEKPRHIESFAGCMLGQLCPPSILIALGILEGLFFKANGISSLSLSYAQGTSVRQDVVALNVLRVLAKEYFGTLDWHVVMYTYMGLFPMTVKGAHRIIADSAKIATMTGCERLIVKTPAEAHRIPTIIENVASLEMAFDASKTVDNNSAEWDQSEYEMIYDEAKSIITAVLDLDKNLGKALVMAFQKGLLDVPYCLHHENANLCRSYVDEQGYLKWGNTGNLPFTKKTHDYVTITAKKLVAMLSYIRNKYDQTEEIPW